MNRRAWLAFAALSLIWGIPYLFIKVAVDGGVSPWAIAGLLLILAGSWLSTDDRIPPNPTAIVTRRRARLAV